MGQRLRRIEDKINTVLALCTSINRKVDRVMALSDDLLAAIKALDVETTLVGTEIASLAARLKNNMTDAEVASVQAAFAALQARLTALAVDPTNPVPVTPPPA